MHVGEQPVVKARLPNGQLVHIEARTDMEQETEIGIGDVLSFDGFVKSIEGVAQSVAKGVEKVQPDKAILEFGLDFGIEQGGLVGFLVKGKGTAALTVTLEWEKGAAAPGGA